MKYPDFDSTVRIFESTANRSVNHTSNGRQQRMSVSVLSLSIRLWAARFGGMLSDAHWKTRSRGRGDPIDLRTSDRTPSIIVCWARSSHSLAKVSTSSASFGGNIVAILRAWTARECQVKVSDNPISVTSESPRDRLFEADPDAGKSSMLEIISESSPLTDSLSVDDAWPALSATKTGYDFQPVWLVSGSAATWKRFRRARLALTPNPTARHFSHS